MASRPAARTIGLLTMTLLSTPASAQAPVNAPDAASRELLMYLAEFEADVDPVELSEWENSRAASEEPQNTGADDDKRKTEPTHEPN